jgi:hypothetical protein
MLTIDESLAQEQEKQIIIPRVDVGLRPFITHSKNMGASALNAGSYYVTAKVTSNDLYIANGISGSIHLHRWGLSDLYTLGPTATPRTRTIANSFTRSGWGFALSTGDSSVSLHYITGASTAGSSNRWTRTEYSTDLNSTIGTTILANINNPSPVPLSNSGPHVPFINVVSDTLWATTHSRNSAIGGSHYYDVYYSNRQGGVWNEFSKLSEIHHRSIGGANDDNRATYLNVHNAGKFPLLSQIGISTTGPNESAFNTFKYETIVKEIWPRQFGGNIYSLELQNPVQLNSIALGGSIMGYTITETSGMSQSFLSVNYPQFDITQRPVLSKTWAYRGNELDTIRRDLGVSVNGPAFNVHTVFYQGASFKIEVNIMGTTPSILGVSAAITNYVGVTDFDVIAYRNDNNSSFDITVANVY